MSTARIYCVVDKDTQHQTMVKATSQAQAMRHIARHQFAVEVATAIEVAEYMQDGLKVENATKEPTTEGGER